MTEKLKLSIPKMSCGNCINSITTGLKGIGLTELNFDLPAKTVEITAESLNEKEIVKVLRRINFPAIVT